MWFCSRKELMLVGETKPDPDWEGIDGLKYIETSEFAQKYVPPPYFKLKNGALPAPTFEKVEKNVAPVKKVEDPVKSDIYEGHAETQKIPLQQMKLEETSRRSLDKDIEEESGGIVFEQINPATKTFSRESLDEDFEYEEEPGQIQFVQMRNVAKTMSLDSHNLEEEEENNMEEFRFQNQEKPSERSVRYSQSAHLANALY